MESLASLIEYIVDAIEEGRISIHFHSDDYYSVGEDINEQATHMLPMLANNISQYIKDEQQQLARELTSPIAMCNNGDILLKTTSKGLQYYKDNKEELYSNIYLKCGANRVYVYATDIDECWVQYEQDTLIKDIGQVPDFGTQPLTKEEIMQEDQQEELVDTPLVTLGELAEYIPDNLSSIKLHAVDIGHIVQILQSRLTVMTLENIENTIYERQEKDQT